MSLFTPTTFYFQAPVAAAAPTGGIVTDGLVFY